MAQVDIRARKSWKEEAAILSAHAEALDANVSWESAKKRRVAAINASLHEAYAKGMKSMAFAAFPSTRRGMRKK